VERHAVAGNHLLAAGRLPLTVLLAAPRGFCAGVDRAVRIVEQALHRFGPPVYVRHQIVHNPTVVACLRAQGAVFVEDLARVPEGALVVFSAHGVPKAVAAEAVRRRLSVLDATCPLVAKVHHEAERHAAAGRHVLMVGHAGHPEVTGTIGQLAPGAITLVATVAEAEAIAPPPGPLAFITQTTLSVEDTAEVLAVLRRRFPAIVGPHREDICYATSNRQAAIAAISPGADLVVVIGSSNSSNSLRLCEVARRSGARRVLLLGRPERLAWEALDGVEVLGVGASASAPEALVQGLLRRLAGRYALTVEERRMAEEDLVFRLPAPLA
jgi:4-hydroxy-3-methylbut-2-enyl diphosphate reductase